MAIDNDLESLKKKFTLMGELNNKELRKGTIINGGGPRVNNQTI